MASLVESGKYGAINTTVTTTNGFYVFMFTSEAYTLHENTTLDGQIITYGELVVKAQYLCSMQVYTNWYWNQHPQQHVITVPTHKIIHPRLEVNAVTDFTQYPQVYVPGHKKKIIPRQPICLTYSDYDYVLEEIVCQDTIEFKTDVEAYSDDEEN